MKRLTMLMLAAIISTSALAGWLGYSYDYDDIESVFMNDVDPGYGSDYGIYRNGFAGKEMVGVIYGFTGSDNSKLCQELVNKRSSWFRNSPMYCERLN